MFDDILKKSSEFSYEKDESSDNIGNAANSRDSNQNSKNDYKNYSNNHNNNHNNLTKCVLDGSVDDLSVLNNVLGNPSKFDFFALNVNLVRSLMLNFSFNSCSCIVNGDVAVGKFASVCFFAAKLIANDLSRFEMTGTVGDVYLHMMKEKISQERVSQFTNPDKHFYRMKGSNDPNIAFNRAIFSISAVELDVLRRMVMDIHPDVMIVNTSSEISIEIAMEIRRFLQSAPLISHAKVVIIRNSGSMNKFAANALLKELENLKKNRYVFFITNNIYNLLDTIRSRSFTIQAKNNNNNKIEDYLRTFSEFNVMKEIHKKMFLNYVKNSAEKARYIFSSAPIVNVFMRLYSVFCIYIPNDRVSRDHKNQTNDEVFLFSIVDDIFKYDVDLNVLQDFFLYILGVPRLNIKNEELKSYYDMKEKCLFTFYAIRTMKLEKKSAIVGLIISLLYKK